MDKDQIEDRATQMARCALVAVAIAALLGGCADTDDGPAATPTPTLPPTATATLVPTATPAIPLSFVRPVDNQLSLAGALDVVLTLPAGVDPDSVVLKLDGVVVTANTSLANGRATAITDVAPGAHRLTAEIGSGESGERSEVSFEAVALNDPDECDVLNDAECLLPYPSSRFLEPANTPTGWRVRFPAAGMPKQAGAALSPEPYHVLDGFSPLVQILMHFRGGVDPALSDASRLLPETRTYTLRSLDSDSPTVLVDADTGERILHFIEPDTRAANSPARQVLFLRPAKSLTPGHRYIVAVRHLVHPDGTAVEPEPAFAALRDRRPTDIDAILARRDHFEDLFARLAQDGVARDDLQLAFDFVVQSDQGLTSQMLSMRDQAFAWLAQNDGAESPLFRVDNVQENDCSQPGMLTWRVVEGSYEVPLFLTSDPVTDPVTPGFLNVDSSGTPVQNGITQPPFTIAIPCSALADGGSPKPFLIAGHGLFGDGRGFIHDITSNPEITHFDYIAGATDWRGLSAPDIQGDASSFIVSQIIFNLGNFPALPDRLRQGQLNTLVLARMLESAVFNRNPAFQSPSGVGLLVGADQPGYYFGASLGGIMGLMFSALSPDIVNANVDVPAINFSILLQRATPFIPFEQALLLSGISDPMQQALLIGVINELWVRGESAGYATHITSDPLAGTNAKHILMTMAWLDQQVSNQATEIAARTLGLPNLVPGSLRSNMPQIPDLPGPLPSALVIYDTGSFDLNDPADAPFIPPLTNQQAKPNGCDPHPRRASIPDSLEQLLAFLQPGGEITNFCDGACDAGNPSEIPYGASAPCDPLAP